MKLVLILFLLGVVSSQQHAHLNQYGCKKLSYSYSIFEHNTCSLPPDQWVSIRKWCADTPKNRQSPVRLDARQCQHREKNGVRFMGFDKTILFNYYNNGHSIAFIPKRGSPRMYITGGSMHGVYKVHSMHFHWGVPGSGTGSEHRIIGADGRDYPSTLELHVVTYKLGLSFNRAKVTVNTISVLGILYQDTNAKNDSRSEEEKQNIDKVFTKLQKCLRSVRNPDVQPTGGGIALRLSDFFPKDKPLKIMNYDGSFTTPGCNPVVQWNVIYPPVSIEPSQIAQFNQLTVDGRVRMRFNNRPLMKLHDRHVRCF